MLTYTCAPMARGNARWIRMEAKQNCGARNVFSRNIPRSAYRSGALLMIADCQFELWRFKDAARTLNVFRRDYPMLHGYEDVLGAISDLAAGRPGALLEHANVAPSVDRWRKGPGGLVGAHAAELLGLYSRSLGFYNGYLDYVHLHEPGSLTPASVEFRCWQGG